MLPTMIAVARCLLPCSCLLAPSTLLAQEPLWATPPLQDQVAVRDGRTGERVSLAAMLDRLAAADAVFVGETHLDEETHRFEHAVYEALIERTGRDTVPPAAPAPTAICPKPPNSTLENERFIALHITTARMKPEVPSSAPTTISSLLSRAKPIALAARPA